MTTEENKDSGLKKAVTEFLGRCGLEDLVVDREVHLNFTGYKDQSGDYVDEKEVDVVASFSYAGTRVLLGFECENSKGPSGSIRAEYRDYDSVLKKIRAKLNEVRVLHSKDNTIRGHHFVDLDEIRLCFVYGSQYPPQKIRTCEMEAQRYSFSVWDYSALRYFLAISSTLGKWTKYELFREMALSLEQDNVYKIPALEVRQKGTKMFLGTIHPGQLLKIAYVIRRARKSTYAYQRMLSKHRIKEIEAFISSGKPESFLPNAVIVVFDQEHAVQKSIVYDAAKKSLAIPRTYCSAWIIDGQHRVYGFLGTQFENWTDEKFHKFDLPIVIFKTLEDVSQTKTFITINYNQKKIKSGLLCDLSTLTGDMTQRLTWASALGKRLNDSDQSPLYERVKITELDAGRPISLSSLVQYGLLETLLGFKPGPSFAGPLARYAPIDAYASFNSQDNHKAIEKQTRLLIYFLDSVKKNTRTKNSKRVIRGRIRENILF